MDELHIQDEALRDNTYELLDKSLDTNDGKPRMLPISRIVGHTKELTHVSTDEPDSPKTPSSIYKVSFIEGCSNCPIKSFVLCYWDNILGPRIAHVWRLRKEYEVPRSLLNCIATQTLNGEISRSPTDPHIDTKYFPVTEHGVIVSSYVFGAANRGDLGVHSFSMLIPHEQRASLINNLCAPWIKRLVGRLKIFIERETDDVAMMLFATELYYMAQMLQSLKVSGLPKYIPICDTLFHWEHRAERALICKAVTSHLLTGGRSLVVGPTASQVNLMIATLALFLPESERLCCRYVDENMPLPYHPEIPIQGILHNASGHLPNSLRDIFLSTLPTALIDMRSKQARISSYIHKHYHARHRALYDDMNSKWRESGRNHYPTTDMFHVPDDAETLVTDFLDDMELLPPSEGLREQFVNNFVRLLEKRAFVLVQHVKHITANGQNQTVVKRRKLKQDLSLVVPGDFKIVLANAEKLMPGIYGYVYKDRIEEYVATYDMAETNSGINE